MGLVGEGADTYGLLDLDYRFWGGEDWFELPVYMCRLCIFWSRGGGFIFCWFWSRFCLARQGGNLGVHIKREVLGSSGRCSRKDGTGQWKGKGTEAEPGLDSVDMN